MHPLRVNDARETASSGSYIPSTAPPRFRVQPERFEFLEDGKWRTMVAVSARRVRALKPFTVVIESSDDLWTVHHAATEAFGAGRTLGEATEDFKNVVLELLEFLDSLRAGELGPIPAGQLRSLREHLTSV